MARPAATGPLKERAARQMRSTAQLLDADHPETITGDHLRDAARVLEHGSTEGAKRHLDAAMELLTPRNLYRHGILDDDAHADAKHHMHMVHRHRLAVQDIEDVTARNDQLRAAARDRQQQQQQPDGQQQPVAASSIMLAPAYLRESRNPRSGEWISGSAGSLFGKKVSKREASGMASLFGAAKAPPKKEQLARLTRSQRAVYKKLKPKYGHQHALRRAQSFDPRMLSALFAGDHPAVQLSARTAMLERTPAPLGRPGGPGLYHVKGMGHTAYFQQVVKALIEKRGMPSGKAYKIAWGALRKWRRGGGHVHPEVRAAATGALAGEAAKGALAHSHAVSWEDVLDAIE